MRSLRSYMSALQLDFQIGHVTFPEKRSRLSQNSMDFRSVKSCVVCQQESLDSSPQIHDYAASRISSAKAAARVMLATCAGRIEHVPKAPAGPKVSVRIMYIM